MKAQEDPSDPAEVIRPHLKSMLNGPFSVPRSHEWDSVEDHQPNKVFVYFSACLHYKIVKNIYNDFFQDNVAAYIWHKFGLYCTVNGVQKFMPQTDFVSNALNSTISLVQK